MVRRKQSAALVLTFLALMPTAAMAAHRPLGAIAGVISDDAGSPVIGALVKLMEPGSSDPIKTIRSDTRGKFVVRNIAPGQYRLRAEARGFMSVAQPVAVKPEVVSSFNFELKRISTMVESRADREDYRWPVRASRRPVLRFNKNGESADDDVIATVALMRRHAPRGMLQLVSGVPMGNVKPLGAYTAANFAIINDVAPNVEMIVSGQVSNSDTTPHRLDITALAAPSDDHKLAISVGLANLRPMDTSGLLPRVRQFSLRVADTWQMTGPFMIVYGVDLTSLTGAGSRLTVTPRFGIKLTAADRTHVTAELFPVRSQDIQTTFDYEGGQLVFTQPETPAVINGRPIADRSRRFQFSFEQVLSENANIEAALFFDQVSGRGVGLLAVPVAEATNQQSVYQAITQQGDAKGIRLTYSHRLAELLSATVGYAFGQGQKLSAAGLVESSPYFVRDLFHVFSARMDAISPWTRTRVAVNFRAAPSNAVFAIDPFYRPPVGEFPAIAAVTEAAFSAGAAATRFQVFDPTISVIVTQELPVLPFLPGRWEASIEARNLLNAHSDLGSEARSVFINRFYRSIRGSLAVRF